jgi:hypothetical protein
LGRHLYPTLARNFYKVRGNGDWQLWLENAKEKEEGTMSTTRPGNREQQLTFK